MDNLLTFVDSSCYYWCCWWNIAGLMNRHETVMIENWVLTFVEQNDFENSHEQLVHWKDFVHSQLNY